MPRPCQRFNDVEQHPHPLPLSRKGELAGEMIMRRISLPGPESSKQTAILAAHFSTDALPARRFHIFSRRNLSQY